MSISSVTVSPLAYKKLVLHTAKYPTARVLGFLLADPTSTGAALAITDSIPLSHHWTALAPMAEVALSLASSYAASKNLAVVGLYEAPELVSERTPSPQASKLVEKIASLASTPEALLLLVNNATLLNPNNHSLSGYTLAGNTAGKTEPKPKSLPGSAVALQDSTKAKQLEEAVRKERSWEKLVDFDGKYPCSWRWRMWMWGKIVDGLTDTLCLLLLLEHIRSPRRSIVGLAAEPCHHCIGTNAAPCLNDDHNLHYTYPLESTARTHNVSNPCNCSDRAAPRHSI